MVYNPMAGGLLSGKHKFENQPESGRFGSSKLSEMYKKRYWNHQLFDAIESLSSVAAEMEKSLPELAFQWLQSKQSVGSILLGASTLEQLDQNLLLLELPQLTVEAVAAIDYSCKALEGPMISYNR
jgi:aryl-alcohol dehydrogenase-like predicted oxidoreductase